MLLTIAAYTNAWEAHSVKGRLEAEGIRAYIAHEHHIWVDWFISNALGGVKVQVAQGDVIAARTVIDDIHAETFYHLLEESEGPLDSVQCPKCTATAITESRWTPRLALLMIGMSESIPLPYLTQRLLCTVCQHTWTQKQRKAFNILTVAIVLIILSVLFFFIVANLVFFCRLDRYSLLCPWSALYYLIK